jgi:hypothetical protein
MASSPFASANDVILWFGEKPCRAVEANNVNCTSQYSQSTVWAVKGYSAQGKENSLPFALSYACNIFPESK